MDDRGGGILIRPGNVSAGGGHSILTVRQRLHQLGGIIGFQIQRQQGTVQHQVKMTAGGTIHQILKTCIQDLVRLGGIEEGLFCRKIGGTVIVIKVHTTLSLVSSAVHISIDHKIHGTAFIDIQDTDTVMGIGGPNLCPVLP